MKHDKMKQNPYVINDKQELDNIVLDNYIKKEQCPKKLHFPERIYLWRIEELNKEIYFGHCAICHTDYAIKELKK